MYYTSHLEDFIKEFYTKLGIFSPQQLQFKEIANKLGISVYFWSNPSQALFLKDLAYIFLNDHQSNQQMWQDFNHELGHVLLHTGNQSKMIDKFREYQEYKANLFMYHACIPSFMLDELSILDYTYETIDLIRELFCVEKSFAIKRLEQYLNNRFYYSCESKSTFSYKNELNQTINFIN